MFTGIVSGLGRIAAVEALGQEAGFGKRLRLEAPPGFLDDVKPGDSIAISGACMTVTEFDAGAGRFTIEVSAESLARTAGLDRPGGVNLEKAMRANDRLDGHLVSGHVDGIGRVVRLTEVGESRELRIAAPKTMARFIAQKGSLAVAGVSLTVNDVLDTEDACELSINVIPHTLAGTTLGALVAGDPVNLEIDLIARYVARMLEARDGPAAPVRREPS